ncbi:MAG TPA: SDR family oxidoreductase [Candidatus Sulfopaludibacter sp.]|nr:SDR family oxidoreductase [Candidatus Sulfopaludibacter sp.]
MAKGTALVTGASSGIGAELARLCAGDGYDLVLVARRADRLQQLAGRLAAEYSVQARILPVDLAVATGPQTVFDGVAGTPIDLLINNAGFGVRGPFAELAWDKQAALLQVNLVAPIHLSRLFLPEMIRRRSGRVLNVASTAAFVPGPFMALYYASKAGLLSFSEAIANELKGTGVTATVLCPGVTQTEFFAAAGVEDSNLLRGGGVMDAGSVAREGYRAMMEGKVEIVAGARNRWTMRGARLLPRTTLAEVTRRLNSGGQ